MNEQTRLPTLAELAAQTHGTDPWECPNCGCKDLRGSKNSEVESIRHPGDAFVRRKRICRHCKQGVVVTQEVPVPKGFRVVIVPDGHAVA